MRVAPCAISLVWMRLPPGLLRVIAGVLGVAMLGSSVALAAGPVDQSAKFKQQVAERGVGKFVKLKETDGTRVDGVVTAIHDETFEVTPKTTMKPVMVPYAQVASLHGKGLPVWGYVVIGVFAVGFTADMLDGRHY